MIKLIIEQEQISEFEDIAQEFMTNTLKRSEALITDHSRLSDFVGCGGPSFNTNTYNELAQQWDSWIIASIKTRYSVELEDSRLFLVDLFNRIKQAQKRILH
jgi:hypothetical protein